MCVGASACVCLSVCVGAPVCVWVLLCVLVLFRMWLMSVCVKLPGCASQFFRIKEFFPLHPTRVRTAFKRLAKVFWACLALLIILQFLVSGFDGSFGGGLAGGASGSMNMSQHEVTCIS